MQQLAGAKAFVNSGYTSGNVTATTVQTLATNEAISAAQESKVRGALVQAAELDITFPQLTQNNPVISVVFTRSGISSFFAKTFGVRTTSVKATAQAEAYNPSGSTTATPVQVAGVKPWVLPNCDPTGNSTATNPNCTGGTFAYFVDPTTGSIENGGSFIGASILLQTPVGAGPATVSVASASPPTPPTMMFYPVDIPENPPTPFCPGTANGNRGIYRDAIQCFNPAAFSCGQLVNDTAPSDAIIDSRITGGSLKSRTDSATQLLVHQTSGFSTAPPADCGGGPYEQDCLVVNGPGNPVLITPGSHNPDGSLVAAQYISRSDSVITVPLFDGRNLCGLGGGNPCAASGGNSAPIVGFLQLGVQASVSSGNVQAVILNASGCNSTPTGTPSGGDVSPIPVRLIQAP